MPVFTHAQEDEVELGWPSVPLAQRDATRPPPRPRQRPGGASPRIRWILALGNAQRPKGSRARPKLLSGSSGGTQRSSPQKKWTEASARPPASARLATAARAAGDPPAGERHAIGAARLAAPNLLQPLGGRRFRPALAASGNADSSKLFICRHCAA